MKSVGARYDGHSEWYDQTFSGYFTEEEAEFLRHSLGAGSGEIWPRCRCSRPVPYQLTKLRRLAAARCPADRAGGEDAPPRRSADGAGRPAMEGPDSLPPTPAAGWPSWPAVGAPCP